jgi:hypothetical protein
MDQQQSIMRIYRVAIKHGEDYTTVEDAVTLPVGASQELIDQAVATGLAIFEAQRLAVEAQISQIRQSAPAPTPEPEASDGQRKLIDNLANEIGMSHEELGELAAKNGVESWETLTKRQAGVLIDELKRRKAALSERPRHEEPPTRQRQEPQATQGPTRRGPPAEQLTRARAAQAEAHERAGMPAPGDRIRNLNDPATDAQLRAITREVNKKGDRRLTALAGQMRAVVGEINPKDLRDPEFLDDLQLTKGQASQLIGILNDETARAAPAA